MSSLASKLLKAQSLAAEVEKSATNSHHKYSYAPADAVVAVGKLALNGAGLIVVNTGVKVDRERDVVVGTFLLLDAESDEKQELFAELPYCPSAGRPDDKAVLASLTELRGYLMIGLLQLERVDASDVSGRDDTEYRRPAQSQQRDDRRPEPPRNSYPPQGNQENLGNCVDCGAPRKIGKSGKPYCGDMCWKNKEPVTNGSEY